MLKKLKNNHLRSYFIISLLGIFFLHGCVTIYNPATQRRETLLIGTKREVALGRDMDKQMQTKLKILKDTEMQTRLDEIGKKVATSSDRQDLGYYFRIVNDKTLNAFALPGGFVYVNSGLMNIATDSELACVLGHEIGHIAARHSVKRLQTVLGYQMLMTVVLGTITKLRTQTVTRAVDIVFNLINLGYSRKDEFLADKLAVRYARKSGFDPDAMITFFGKLEKEAKAKGNNFKLVFLSSHPPIKERIKAIEEEIKLNPKE